MINLLFYIIYNAYLYKKLIYFSFILLLLGFGPIPAGKLLASDYKIRQHPRKVCTKTASKDREIVAREIVTQRAKKFHKTKKRQFSISFQ